MNDNHKLPALGRPNGTLHIDSARLLRKQALQTQESVEATLKFRAELRLATGLLPPTDRV